MKIIDLENIQTRNVSTKEINGRFIPLYRDWENKIEQPQFVYMSACEVGEVKGPHLHRLRHANFACVKGSVVFITQEPTGYCETIVTATEPKTIHIEPNIPCAHINIGFEEAIIINICSPAWKPDNQDSENVKFEGYDWFKWVEHMRKKLLPHSTICNKNDCDCGVETNNNKVIEVIRKMKAWNK